MGGHGTGLDIHEPPSIDAWNEMEIQEGMVLSIEPWVYESLKVEGGTGKYGIQNQFEVTRDGCRKINGLRRDIIQVSHPIKG
jgi:Xaa-Pro dipeptidase